MSAYDHLEYGYQRGIFKLNSTFTSKLAFLVVLLYDYKRAVFKYY